MLYSSYQLERFMALFFEAMLHGWISDDPEDKKRIIKVADFPGYNIFSYPKEDLLLIDRWFVYPGTNYSDGKTTEYQDGKPIWWMEYSGFYRKEHIPFLKDVLHKTYEAHKFFGGRGPVEPVKYDHDNLYYQNKLSEIKVELTNFEKFAGCEYIYTPGHEYGPFIHGHHKFSGGLF